MPYYEIASLADGSLQHVRKTKVVSDVRHALAFHLQTEFCPHTADCGERDRPPPYYTTVDVLVIDGEPTHLWNTPTPFGTLPARTGIDLFYHGDRYDRAFRYYQNRKSVSFTFGFHKNHTRSCEPRLHDRVNIGVYCSWAPTVFRLSLIHI